MKKIRIVFILLLFASPIIGYLLYANSEHSHPLLIPPILQATEVTKMGTIVYNLEAKNSQHDFGNGYKTHTFSYNNNTYLGPTIRMTKGTKVDINVKNSLNEATTTHWHGLYVDGDSDGNMHQPIAPSQTWTAHLDIQQDAEMAYYHPHIMGHTAAQVYKGLAGLIFIDDAASQSIPIPKTYGVDDIPIVIQNRTFQSGELYYESNDMTKMKHTKKMDHSNMEKMDHSSDMDDMNMEFRGEETIVNGSIKPFFEIKDSIVRLRIINADNTITYKLSFSDERDFYIIATDGGLLDQPYKVDSLVLAPSERKEVLLQFTDDSIGTNIRMKLEDDQNKIYTAMTFKVVDKRENYTNIPSTLLSNNTLTSKEQKNYETQKIDKKILIASDYRSGNSGDNIVQLGLQKGFDMNKINFYVQPNTTEIWTVQNEDDMMIHPFHIHNSQFHVISIDGKTPSDGDKGLHDSIIVYPNSTIKIAIHFKETTGVFPFHCHIIDHEDAGMMGQFMVGKSTK